MKRKLIEDILNVMFILEEEKNKQCPGLVRRQKITVKWDRYHSYTGNWMIFGI